MHATSTDDPQGAMPGAPVPHYLTLDSLGLEPARLDFYQLLLSCPGGEAAADSMGHALRFRTQGYGRASFIGSLDALPAALARFPLWRAELAGLPGVLPRATLLDCVQEELGQPPGDFLAGPSWKTAQDDVWQSLLALALTPGQLADAALMRQLSDVLRVGYFLRLLELGAPSLASQDARRAVLDAQLLLPPVVAPSPR